MAVRTSTSLANCQHMGRTATAYGGLIPDKSAPVVRVGGHAVKTNGDDEEVAGQVALGPIVRSVARFRPPRFISAHVSPSHSSSPVSQILSLRRHALRPRARSRCRLCSRKEGPLSTFRPWPFRYSRNVTRRAGPANHTLIEPWSSHVRRGCVSSSLGRMLSPVSSATRPITTAGPASRCARLASLRALVACTNLAIVVGEQLRRVQPTHPRSLSHCTRHLRRKPHPATHCRHRRRRVELALLSVVVAHPAPPPTRPAFVSPGMSDPH